MLFKSEADLSGLAMTDGIGQGTLGNGKQAALDFERWPGRQFVDPYDQVRMRSHTFTIFTSQRT